MSNKENRLASFLKRKNIVFSLQRYGIDAMSAMAQGLFCTLLVGTILNTLGSQFHIGFLTASVVEIAGKGYTVGSLASAMVGPAMAAAIGSALGASGLVLFSLIPVGYATNVLGGAGGPFAVYIVSIVAQSSARRSARKRRSTFSSLRSSRSLPVSVLQPWLPLRSERLPAGSAILSCGPLNCILS